MAQKSKSALQTEITTSFPDNVSGTITPLLLRNFLNNLLDSIYNKTDDQVNLPLYGYKVLAGQFYWAGAQFDTLEGAGDAIINTGGVVTTTTTKVAVDAGTTVTKWVTYVAQLSTEWGTYNLGVKVNGQALEIYPKIGGAKIEYAHLEYDGANWQLVTGGGSTMTISAESANQITLTHGDCGTHPAFITPRAGSREVASANAISSTSTVINLTNSSGAAFTPGTGERVSVARFSAADGLNAIIDPNSLTSVDGRITYFGIYQE